MVLNSVAPLLPVLGGVEIPTAAVVAAGAVAVGAVQHTELRSVSVAQADALMTDEEVGKIILSDK